MKIRPFNVLPRLPETLEPLRTLAYNMWLTWNWDAVQLFIRLDAAYWEKTYQNPALMLGLVPQERFEELSRDEGFVATMHRVSRRYMEYMEAPTWFSRTYADAKNRTIAYFSCEYGIDVGLPIYSGGLGVLAGDHLKSASDLGLPMVAVGLLYREGYIRQYLTTDGWQREEYPRNDWDNMPVTLAIKPDGKPVRGQVEIGNEAVQFQVWRVQVGRVPLFLLDTDVPENSPEQRAITTRLYVADRDTRLRQEIVLGIGGMRALDAMGIEPAVCHMNEGHSALLALERIRLMMVKHNLTRQQASEVVWATTVFTTHTPVPAGNERFAPDQMQRHLGGYVSKLNMSWDEFMASGRENPADGSEQFCLTVLALRNAAYDNGVSTLHGKVSRKLWQSLWPDLPVDDIPIGSITNGIHSRSWLSHDMSELLDRYLGPRFIEEPMDFALWRKVESIPDAELWRTHELRRERLIWFARRRLRQQMTKRGVSANTVAEADQVLDPEALTIGFARRFAAYKRGALLFRDPKRLAALLSDPKRPVQFIFAGKAHPADAPGKDVIKNLVHSIRADEFKKKIIFLEDYDINVARYLVQGADVWLNTPRPPLEASGTSGMKAVANGGLHLSTYDGWWCEGYSPEVGWVIGNGEAYENPDEQDAVESAALYDILESQVIPLFYQRERDNLPRQWIAKMKQSMSQLGSYFNTNRMTSDYVRDYYLDAGLNFDSLLGDGQAGAKTMAAWRDNLNRNWNSVRVEWVKSNVDKALVVGDRIEVEAGVRLGALKPDDVEVQFCVGGHSSEEYIQDSISSRMVPDPEQRDGFYIYRANTPCTRSGRRGFAVRVLPHHTDLVHPFVPGKVIWG